MERLDPSGAWVEAQRSAPAGPTHAATTPLTAGAGSWRLVVRQEAGPQAELTLFSQTAGFGALAVGPGSIPTPGDAAGALSVGAVKWTGTALEPYSSQGPTDDGRAKPDLVGPVYVTSNPEWPGTAGTSAATAHVAGAAAPPAPVPPRGRPARRARPTCARRWPPGRSTSAPAAPTRSTGRAWPASTPRRRASRCASASPGAGW